MGYQVGFDENWKRDIGYGVPAYCDHPGCMRVIDRGLSNVCGGDIKGGARGCGLYFCSEHLHAHVRLPRLCERCYPRIKKPFSPKADHLDWMMHKLTHESWAKWRSENIIFVSSETAKQLRYKTHFLPTCQYTGNVHVLPGEVGRLAGKIVILF